jgi:daunorubicin resistance ABC transporter ATP-binding subunit
MPAVTVQGVRKRFGSTEALAGVDLEVARGEVLGLLGPNGAGKTTLVRVLATLLPPDEGEARIFGLDVVREAPAVRRAIGLTGQYAAVDELLTGRENLRMFGELFHLSTRDAKRRADELLDRFDLADAADRPARTYSGGMRRRLDLASSLLVRPQLLFLDEPTTGLDPRSRNAIWDVTRELVAEGTTLLLTTQYLEEADVLADRIAVIDHGRIIAEGTGDELKDRTGGQVIDVLLAEGADRDRAIAAVQGAEAGPEPRRLLVHVVGDDALGDLARVSGELRTAEVSVRDVGLRRPTLDDVFLELTGTPAAPTTDGSEAQGGDGIDTGGPSTPGTNEEVHA